MVSKLEALEKKVAEQNKRIVLLEALMESILWWQGSGDLVDSFTDGLRNVTVDQIRRKLAANRPSLM